MIEMPPSYSAHVELDLIIDDRMLALSHVGSRDVVIRDPCEPMPPCDAVLRISVDGCVERHNVHLPDGSSGPHVPIRYLNRSRGRRSG